MTKVIIQVPCLDEEATLPATLAELPRELPGADVVEWLVIDDGSTDRTSEVAREHGVDHVVRFPRNRGLAAATVAGLEAAVAAGADIVVTTDADNQYCAADIPKLLEPILAGRAEMVIGSRPIGEMEQYSFLKRLLHRLGTWVVARASGSHVPDPPSGFRAYTRDVAMRLNVFSEYTYTLETVIQAGRSGIAVTSVPVRTNPATRESRLMDSVWGYVRRSVVTIVRIAVTYRPFEFFAVPGAVSFGVGLLLGLRFLTYWLVGDGDGKVQSVVLSALLLGLGCMLVVVALVVDLIAANRKLLENLDRRLQHLESDRRRGSDDRRAG